MDEWKGGKRTNKTNTQEKEKKRSIFQFIWLLVAEAVWMIYSATDDSACQTLKNLRPRESISSALYGQ